jgi:ribosomal protein L37AE/L43A
MQHKCPDCRNTFEALKEDIILFRCPKCQDYLIALARIPKPRFVDLSKKIVRVREDASGGVRAHVGE